jgi:hypothetical protein
VHPTEAHPTEAHSPDTDPPTAPVDTGPGSNAPQPTRSPLSEARLKSAVEPDANATAPRTDNRFGSRVGPAHDPTDREPEHDADDWGNTWDPATAPFAAMRAKAEARSAGRLGPLQRVASIPTDGARRDVPTPATTRQNQSTDLIRRAESSEKRTIHLVTAVVLVLVAVFGIRHVLNSRVHITAATPVSELSWRTADGPATRWRADVPSKATVVSTAWSVDGSTMQRLIYDVPGAATEIWVIDTNQSAVGVADSIVDTSGASVDSTESVDQDWGAAVRVVATNNDRTMLVWAGSIDSAVVVVRIDGLGTDTLSRGQAVLARITSTFRPI